MSKETVLIVAAKRTPLGGLLGDFKDLTAPQLGSIAIKAAIEQSGVEPTMVDEVYMGNVISAGLGQAPARQASLAAGIPQSVPCTTVSKVCGSGMKAVMIACDQIIAGSADIILAGGMESMTGAPYLVSKARSGIRLGHSEFKDSMMLDGLEDAATGSSMGVYGEACADQQNIVREDMDGFALDSLAKANAAIEKGNFAAEIAPVVVNTRKGKHTVDTDEQPGNADPEKIPHLRPAFKEGGGVTAANSSSISDGAAAMLLMRKSQAVDEGFEGLAEIVAHASFAQAPADFCSAPVGAIAKVLDKAGWSADEVDLFEVNEAFAVVTMLAMQEYGIDPDRINVNGGACALGHPLGASGARILVTLIYAMQRLKKKRGIATLCIGGGEATAVAIQLRF